MPHLRLNHSGMALSIAAHLTVLTVGLGYAGVRPFETAPTEAIAVDIVSPDEVREATQETAPKPAPPLEIPDLSSADQPAAPPKSAVASAPQQQQQPAQQAMPSAAPATPKDQARPARPPATAPQPAASWRPPEPDLSIKYQVNLGLPALPGDDFDAPAFHAAKVSTDDIAKFREQLKKCSVLPGSIAPTDKVTIRLRASFRPDGTLASAPLLIEASASAKGPLLMQAAIEALGACQPYAALPADRYSEWKVLDLGFTPQDFRGG
ncbi:hypothetical protein [Bradyrhizobium sp.]|jgi:hypothetical protein|uniref:hypothetical protein n=1 Tax=Bradyrhizobium sp. TaxID=376 RepID=UPI002E09A743|nr:hypothetical protein [Bradyrhizobium sp.]